MKFEAVKDKHLNEIFRVLNIRKKAKDLMLAELMKLDLKKYEREINEIVSSAVG